MLVGRGGRITKITQNNPLGVMDQKRLRTTNKQNKIIHIILEK